MGINAYNCYLKYKKGVVATNFHTYVFMVNEIEGSERGGNSINE